MHGYYKQIQRGGVDQVQDHYNPYYNDNYGNGNGNGMHGEPEAEPLLPPHVKMPTAQEKLEAR